MNVTLRTVFLSLVLTLAAGQVFAQDPDDLEPAVSFEETDDLEPAVTFDESPDELEPAVTFDGPAEASVAEARPEPAAPPAELEPAVSTGRAMDTLVLDSSSIKGNSELPKVLVIVPWKKSDLGDVVGKPVNSLLDEILSPVDRTVFQRHLRYYNDLYNPEANASEDE